MTAVVRPTSNRHAWTADSGDTCAKCGLRREGMGAGPYGAMRYYRDDGKTYDYKAGPCPGVPPSPQDRK